MSKDKCVICEEEAITTVCHFLVCKEHDRLYQEEGRKYLPDYQRKIFNMIINAGERRSEPV